MKKLIILAINDDYCIPLNLWNEIKLLCVLEHMDILDNREKVWVVSAHYSESSQHPETSKILAICGCQETALTMKTHWENMPGGEVDSPDEPEYFITIEAQTIIRTTSAVAAVYAIEWNESLAQLHIPLRDKRVRYYEISPPKPVSTIVDLSQRRCQPCHDSAALEFIVSTSPQVRIWYCSSREEVIRQWKKYDDKFTSELQGK